jgi:hypothetical protein
VLDVRDDGKLDTEMPEHYGIEGLISTLEALLIEGLEPPQNRRRGDDFNAAEFLQVEDPDAKKDRLLQELQKRL